jgi:hypothetical protein
MSAQKHACLFLAPQPDIHLHNPTLVAEPHANRAWSLGRNKPGGRQ